MEASTPIQPTASAKPWWSARRVCVVLTLLFAVIFTASWWLTPIEPYATLNLDDECSLFLPSPDGTMLATAGKKHIVWSEGPIRVWDIERGHELFSVAHGRKAIGTVLFSTDSGLLAAHESDGDLKLWNARTGEEVASIGIGMKSVNWVDFQFSPDGRFLVFQPWNKDRPAKDYITFWNVESKQEQGNIESYLSKLAFAPDGQAFATYHFVHRNGVDVTEVLLWKMEQTPVLVKQHHITAIVVAFSPDLKTFATADDLLADDLPDGKDQIAIWDMMTGKKRWSVIVNEHGSSFLSFIANGKILSAHDVLGRTTLWDVTSTPKEIGSFSKTPAVSPDGEWLALPLDSGAKLIRVSAPGRGADLIVSGDLRRLTPPPFIPGMTPLSTPSFSPDSKMILVTDLSRSGQKPFLEKWLPEKYNPFRARPDASVIRVWDTDSHREVATFTNCGDAWFSPDGNVLATLRDDRKAIDLWKVPFRASPWQISGWAVIAWLTVVAVSWAGVKTRKMLLSRRP